MSKIVVLKNGDSVEKCKKCERDWDIVRHSSSGLCRGCYRMEQHKEAKPPQKWSDKFDHCQNKECPNTKNGITEQPHNADGLCRSCYSAKQRYEDIEHSHQIEAARRAQPGFAEKQKGFYTDWYERNKEEHNKNTTKYGQEHPEWRRACEAKYREANHEMCRASYKRWYAENKEKSAATFRKWRQENPEEARQHSRNRRARLANAEGSFTADEWVQVCEDHDFQCYHCHKGLEEGILLTPDHLISIKEGGSNYIGNIAPLCGSCNSSKLNRDLWEFDPEYFGKRYGG